MGRLRVALFVSEFEDPYTNALCRGAVKAAEEKGYDLYIFPGKFLEKKSSPARDAYGYQNNCLFEFISQQNIDIAVVNTGNIAMNLDVEAKKRFLQKIPVPVVLISDTISGCSTVNFDSRKGMVAGIEHLIRDHHKKKFGYVCGPKNNVDGVERYRIFVECMQANGIPDGQYKVVEGNFSYNCIEVIEKLLDEFPDMDALVCANDMMCYGAYQVLEARNIKVGKDIAVMGFDDAPYSAEIKPGLSTVKADPAGLGYEAVYLCEETLKNRIQEKLVDTTFVLRQSCGCDNPETEETKNLLEEKAHLESLNHTLVSISRNVVNYEEENNKIYSMILNSLCSMNVHSVYLYTFQKEIEWKKGQKWERPDYVQLKAYYREPCKRKPEIIYQPKRLYYYPVDSNDIKEIDETNQDILFDEIFENPYSAADKAATRVVTLLYAGETQYGFLVWEMNAEYFGNIGPLTYQVASALKTNRLLYKKSQMASALAESLLEVKEKNAILEEVSKVDELTQIYNRRGFLDHMKRNVIAKENEGKQAIAIYADMNNLKLVNDQFGHEEGDYALRSIGQILYDAVHGMEGKGEVGRIGGDEFCAYLILAGGDDEQLLRQRIDEMTEMLNAGNDKTYYVSMSVGTKHFVCSAEIDISVQLEQADTQLYIYKRNKRKSILK